MYTLSSFYFLTLFFRHMGYLSTKVLKELRKPFVIYCAYQITTDADITSKNGTLLHNATDYLTVSYYEVHKYSPSQLSYFWNLEV